VHFTMHMDDENFSVPVIITIGASAEEHAHVRKCWKHFDVTAAECFKDADKARMLAVIESHPGGLDCFSNHVRALAATLLRLNDARAASKVSGASVTTSIRSYSSGASECMTSSSVMALDVSSVLSGRSSGLPSSHNALALDAPGMHDDPTSAPSPEVIGMQLGGTIMAL